MLHLYVYVEELTGRILREIKAYVKINVAAEWFTGIIWGCDGIWWITKIPSILNTCRIACCVSILNICIQSRSVQEFLLCQILPDLSIFLTILSLISTYSPAVRSINGGREGNVYIQRSCGTPSRCLGS